MFLCRAPRPGSLSVVPQWHNPACYTDLLSCFSVHPETPQASLWKHFLRHEQFCLWRTHSSRPLAFSTPCTDDATWQRAQRPDDNILCKCFCVCVCVSEVRLKITLASLSRRRCVSRSTQQALVSLRLCVCCLWVTQMSVSVLMDFHLHCGPLLQY